MLRTRAEAFRSKRSLAPPMWAALVYVLLATVLLGYTWYNTRPAYHGFYWLPVSLLTYPSVGIPVLSGIQSVPNAVAILIGIAGNAAGIFLLGAAITKFYDKLDRR
jgi:hypothetical protein